MTDAPCPVPGCCGTLEASTRIYLDIGAATTNADGSVTLETLTFSHLNDHLDGVPCNVESELTVSCTEGHEIDYQLGDGVRARLAPQPIGGAPRTLGRRGGAR